MKRECHTKLDCEKFMPCLPAITKSDLHHEVFTSSYYKHYRRTHGPKYCMSATMMHGYPGISRGKSEYDSGIGDQFFRGGVEPPRTGGGNGKIFSIISRNMNWSILKTIS